MAVILKINVEKEAISITFIFIECVYIVNVDLLAMAHKWMSEDNFFLRGINCLPSSMWELEMKPSHRITNYEKSIIISLISFSCHVYVTHTHACMLHPGIETVVCMWRTEVNFRYLYWFLTFLKLCLSMDLELPYLASLVSQQASETFLSLLPGNCYHMFAVLACSCTCWGSKADAPTQHFTKQSISSLYFILSTANLIPYKSAIECGKQKTERSMIDSGGWIYPYIPTQHEIHSNYNICMMIAYDNHFQIVSI